MIRILAFSFFSAFALLAACSSDGGAVTNADAGADSALQSCALPKGSYAVHYTADPANDLAACQVPADVTATLTAEGQAPNDMTAGGSCSTTNDLASCIYDATCKSDKAGLTIVSTSHETTTGTSLSGTMSVKTTKDADKSVVSNCVYTFTWQVAP